MHQEGKGHRQEGRLRTGRFRVAAVLAAATLLTLFGPGCGADAARSGAEVDLTITIGTAGDRAARTVWRLRCDPVGGNWPRAVAACASLRPADLVPIGPETRDLVRITSRPVRVAGTAFGRPVALVFDTHGSSTRRARFEQLREALGPRPFGPSF